MEKIKFYDTNELLKNLDKIEGKIYLSSITLQELEHIKTSRNKDEDVKFEARRVTRWLRDNEDKYVCEPVTKGHYEFLEKLNLPTDNDNLIVATAFGLKKEYEVEFYTEDLCCRNLAKNIFELEVKDFKDDKIDKYKGYKEIIMTDEELAKFYESPIKENNYGLLINEYLVLKNALNQPIDAYKFNGSELIPLSVKHIKSDLLGDLKPKDFYQQCVLDSFQNNKITVVKGKAGSGKSYLAMNYLFSQLEKGKIDKIIMFVNPVATRNSARLGFYPGTKDEKILDSASGNFLVGKLGDRIMVQTLITKGQLILLPLSDLRGYDTTGMNAGIYITESQNMTVDHMKLALQRIGDDCICIIDGDCDAQVDEKAFEGSNNGMRRLSEIFRNRALYGEIELNTCYRSEIAKIADLM